MEKELLIAELRQLLIGGTAHVGLKDALANIPFNKLGEIPDRLPYSIWQLAEHIRIAQWDMLEFSKNGLHESPKWPDDYWPQDAAPKAEDEWKSTIENIEYDLHEFIALLEKEELFKPIAHGKGQTILREALQIADHNAYHIGEIIIIRRLLGIWKS